MSCCCCEERRQMEEKLAIANIKAIADVFKEKYKITDETEKQIVEMAEDVPPGDEPPMRYLERLYRLWYAANGHKDRFSYKGRFR